MFGISKEARGALNPIAIVLAGIAANIESMELDELRQLRQYCDEPTVTNCWRWTYRAAQYLRPILDDEIQRLKQLEANSG